MKLSSYRQGGDVYCRSRRAWVDLERCYTCPSFRSATDSTVVCSFLGEPLNSYFTGRFVPERRRRRQPSL